MVKGVGFGPTLAYSEWDLVQSRHSRCSMGGFLEAGRLWLKIWNLELGFERSWAGRTDPASLRM